MCILRVREARLTCFSSSFHALIPYGPLKLGLSLVNPTLAIRAIVSIMLGQPAGQPSLFQRIFGIVCSGGIKAQKAQADALKKRIGDEGLSRAVEAHVYAPFTQRSATRDASGRVNLYHHFAQSEER